MNHSTNRPVGISLQIVALAAIAYLFIAKDSISEMPFFILLFGSLVTFLVGAAFYANILAVIAITGIGVGILYSLGQLMLITFLTYFVEGREYLIAYAITASFALLGLSCFFLAASNYALVKMSTPKNLMRYYSYLIIFSVLGALSFGLMYLLQNFDF
jgi:hypothetical protein